MNVFNLPDLGEGLPDAEISSWHVKVGDVVKIDQPIVSMETAKAVVEVPSPQAGVIAKLHGNTGDVIKTGAPLVEFENTDTQKKEEHISKIRDTGTVAGEIKVGDTILVENARGVKLDVFNSYNGVHGNTGNIKATPAIRALAKQLGVDLAAVSPTGAGNTITALDVNNFANSMNAVKHNELEQQAGRQLQDSNMAANVSLDFSPLHGSRRTMAQIMQQSHQQVVAVTVVDDVVLLNWHDETDISVKIIQALVAAIKQEPKLNAWFDGNTLSSKQMSIIDLGIACDNGNDLLVPVIKNIAALSATEIRAELNIIKNEVSTRTVLPAKLHGATFTLSNFGKFAGRYANPVVVPPQVAILGAGAIREEVVAVNGKPQVSKVLPLSLTFDHRACTGGEATRFLAVLIQELSR